MTAAELKDFVERRRSVGLAINNVGNDHQYRLISNALTAEVAYQLAVMNERLAKQDAAVERMALVAERQRLEEYANRLAEYDARYPKAFEDLRAFDAAHPDIKEKE
jgi:hypothetical protein